MAEEKPEQKVAERFAAKWILISLKDCNNEDQEYQEEDKDQVNELLPQIQVR